MHNIKLIHQKFIVVADTDSDELLEIFYDITLPSMHIELFGAVEKVWKKKKRNVYCRGGGMVAIIDNFIIFYARSGHYGRYMDEDVYALVREHPDFRDRSYTVLSKAGTADPYELIREYRNKK
jgi:hypothetical protein